MSFFDNDLSDNKLDFKKLFGLEKENDINFVNNKIALNSDLNQLLKNIKKKKF